MQFIDDSKDIIKDNNGLSTMTIEKIIAQARTYLHKESNIELIQKAYNVAANQHSGQFRKSGEPYIQHPLEVAYLLTTLKAGPSTVCAGLLHDVVEDTDFPIEKVEKEFSADIAKIVDGVTKIGKLKYMTKEKALAKDHQKILIAMAKDIRVVLVKLVDRLHNMRTLQYQTPEKQKVIAKETLDLYAPLAHRLGMYRLKAELEDLSLRYLSPDEYEQIKQLIEDHKMNRENDLQEMQVKLNELLVNNNFTKFEVKGRVKNIYSVAKKMITKEKTFDQIYDLLALRVLVPTVADCYHVLGLVHSIWTPVPMRFKDYIATPKPNLYQSLHTTVVGINGNIFEIQIRTYEMDNTAELGIAAHWTYKEENKNYTPEKEQAELGEALRWYRELLTYAEMGEEEDKDPLQNIKDDIFSANIYVFTPKGDVIDIPNGGTPLDFAYRIHTEVGNHTVGAIVNGKIVPLTYKLKTGDVIDIKTNKNFNGPTEAWLKIVHTSHAKHKIIAILNKRKRDNYIEKGKNDFEAIMQLNNCQEKLTDKLVKDNFKKYSITTIDDLFYEIGRGTVSEKGAFNRLFATECDSDELLLMQYNESKRHQTKSNAYGLIVDGLDKAQIKLASCCHPVLGDPIVGYISKGNGIIVHRYECPNCKNFEENRIIPIYWDKDASTKSYETCINVLCYNRRNILTDVINALNSTLISISSVTNQKTKNGELLIKIKMLVKDIDTLEVAFANIRKISDIYSVERIFR